MTFIADLHIHSRFSMATSRALNIAHLSLWAKRKGIHVLGTGDFTHPKWREELARDLAYDEKSGFYRPRPTSTDPVIPENAQEPYFCLQTEISSIYKRGGKTRKVHNLVFVPNMEIADKLSRRLALIGNINSDGRPILGLDSRDLLELVLESSPQSILIPAHIWTPWFSLFGSKSGFNTLEECYGDLSSHIFALETGLSSDPAMNRHWSALDKYALISNSDAHSGPNLGREANLFAGEPSYKGMFTALRNSALRKDKGDGTCQFLGTCEFYPEEGKYHLDGHRACGIVFEPRESLKHGNLCPACGKPLTIGVLHRVMELADRLDPATLPNEPVSRMLVPLPEVISQILGQKPGSVKVQTRYEKTLHELGTEMEILCSLPEENIRAYWEPLGEAVSRLRAGKVLVNSGFDGQYGVVNIFTDDERKDLAYGKIHALPGFNADRAVSRLVHSRHQIAMEKLAVSPSKLASIELSAEQQAAIKAGPLPVFVIAGPGAGKTRCLIERTIHLMRNTPPDKILAITYTRRAAEEMRDRLAPHLKKRKKQPCCDTLHALAWRILKEKYPYRLMGEYESFAMFKCANQELTAKEVEAAWRELTVAREQCQELSASLKIFSDKYDKYKGKDAHKRDIDFCDLLELLCLENLRGRWREVLVDEMQDLSPLQLKAISSLLPEDGKGFFGIGDPDQAIYSFRGAFKDILSSLRALWSELDVLRLGQSWRSAQNILDMAKAALGSDSPPLHSRCAHTAELRIFQADDERGEAIAIAREIARLLGPTAHTLLDSENDTTLVAPSDVAILVRTRAQAGCYTKALAEHGIPFTAPAQEEFWHNEGCLELINHAKGSDTDSPPEQLAQLPDFEHLAQNACFGDLCRAWHKAGSWHEFFEELAWLDEADMIVNKSKGVHILTMHAAKGLEFHTVFVPGMEQGLMPLEAHGESLEEERRLLYVALTRASHSVILSHTGSRHVYGKKLVQKPSPFLKSLEDFCVKKSFFRHTRQKIQKLSLLQKPDKALK